MCKQYYKASSLTILYDEVPAPVIVESMNEKQNPTILPICSLRT